MEDDEEEIEAEAMTEVVPTISAAGTGLVASARGWIRRAIADFMSSDYDAAGIHGPLGLEHLGKAALWAVSPALLVLLKPAGEASLVLLATGKSLSHPELRTIGLDDVLRRLVRVVDRPCPASETGRRQVVACRNGGIHLGSVGNAPARQVTTDVLLLCDWLLLELDLDRAEFYGQEMDDADRLLRTSATEIEVAVAAKISAAGRKHRELRDAVDDAEEWAELSAARMAKAEGRWSEMEADGVLCVRNPCPACRGTGSLISAPEVDVDADVEFKHGETTVWPYYIVHAHPEAFICAICSLRLWGPRELTAAGISTSPRELNGRELGEFDPAHFLDMHAPRADAERAVMRDVWDEYN